MRTVVLTSGHEALVDDRFYDLVSRYTWTSLAKRKPDGALYTVYAQARVAGRVMLMHRMIMSAESEEIVDHVDGDGLHNWRENLRRCTLAQNQWNVGLSAANTSGVKGVDIHGGRFRARISVNGRSIWLGHFDSMEEAVEARRSAEVTYHGEFARAQ